MLEAKERAELLAELRMLEKTEPYQKLAKGEADDFDVATLRVVREHLRWRKAGHPGLPEDRREGMLAADRDREKIEARAFAAGWIPPWLIPDFPGAMVYEDGSSLTTESNELRDAPRDPNMRPDIEP